VLFLADNTPGSLEQRLQADPALNAYVNNTRQNYANPATPLSSDDWPYLYIEKRGIPKMYLSIIACLLLLVLAAAKLQFGGIAAVNPHFFLLGAGFLLLEFQNISKSSLLFGATWQVNAYTITSILALILLANVCTALFKRINIRAMYFLLGASLLAQYLLPPELFNAYSFLVKATLVALFLNLPIFFAGLIFIHDFRNCQAKSNALASNFFGACLGGLMEPLSFLFGVKALILVTLLCYCASYVVRKPN